jgi:hypothetical protein
MRLRHNRQIEQVPVHNDKACGGSRRIAPLILKLDTRLGELVMGKSRYFETFLSHYVFYKFHADCSNCAVYLFFVVV